VVFCVLSNNNIIFLALLLSIISNATGSSPHGTGYPLTSNSLAPQSVFKVDGTSASTTTSASKHTSTAGTSSRLTGPTNPSDITAATTSSDNAISSVITTGYSIITAGTTGGSCDEKCIIALSIGGGGVVALIVAISIGVVLYLKCRENRYEPLN
jgi:hypothetical protein